MDIVAEIQQLQTQLIALQNKITQAPSSSIIALRAELSEKISVLSKQLAVLRRDVGVPVDLHDEFAALLKEETNAGKIKGYPINISQLSHRSVLVYDNKLRQFVAEPYRTHEFIEETVINVPVSSAVAVAIYLIGTTTDGTGRELLINNANRFTVDANTTVSYTFNVIAREVGGNQDNACFRIEGAATRDATTLRSVGTPTVTTVARSNKVPWSLQVNVNDVLKTLILTVTGEVNKTIYWNALLTTVSIIQ